MQPIIGNMHLLYNKEKIDQLIGEGIVSIVPIAFPLVAGAGTMTTLLSLRAKFML